MRIKRLLLAVLVLAICLSFTAPIRLTSALAAPNPKSIVGSIDSNYTLTLNSSLKAGVYTLYYENSNGILPDYAPVCTVPVKKKGEGAVISTLIPENWIPDGCMRIGVYDKQNKKVGYIPLGSDFQRNPGAKLYTFAALSDVHLPLETGPEDFERALHYINNETDASFICISGDLTYNGTPEELTAVREMIDRHSPNLPVYLSSGNHDIDHYIIANNRILFEKYTGNPLCHSFTHGNDVFIMFGVARCADDGIYWGKAELQWLYETLEANRDKRCFVFQHILSSTSSGDALNAYPYLKLNGSTPFESLMAHYPNTVWFHGHSHSKFELQSASKSANIDLSNGFRSVHISSLTVPRDLNASKNEFINYPEESQGYLVDVYENAIVLRGRDFDRQEFMPIACYYLDTTLQTVAPGAYTDPSGVIDPREKAIKLQFEKHVQIELDTGKETVNKRRAASQMIPVTPGAQYTLAIENNFWCAADICFYDENQQYLGYVTGIEINDSDWDVPTTTVTFSPMENAAFLRLRANYAPQETEEGNDCYLARITLGFIPPANP